MKGWNNLLTLISILNKMIAFSEKESQTQNIPPISQKKNYVLKTDLLKHSFTSSTTSQFDEENNNLIQG